MQISNAKGNNIANPRHSGLIRLSEIKTVALSEEAFNTGIPRSSIPKPVLQAMSDMDRKLKDKLKIDVQDLYERVGSIKEKDRDTGLQLKDQIHEAASVLFLEWSDAREHKDRAREFAAARFFNQMTLSARKIDKNFGIFDKSHLDELLNHIQDDLKDMEQKRANDPTCLYAPANLVNSIRETAAKRTHENAWPWVVLPTFPQQHYGRILLERKNLHEDSYKTYLTQATFTNGEATLFHTHGQNWAFAAPLGPTGSNRHTNTMWEPHEAYNPEKETGGQLFPLRQMPKEKNGLAYYHAGDVVVIPPRSIHGISGSRKRYDGISIDELASLSEYERAQVIKNTKFGEQSCLHIYRPSIIAANDFLRRPIMDEKDFFERNDMVVMDYKNNKVWAAGGGAWPQLSCLDRFGPSGEHCGKCYVEDVSRTVIPQKIVLEQLIDKDLRGAILYPRKQAGEF